LLSIMQHNRKGDKGNVKFRLVALNDMHFESDLQHSAFLHGNRTMVNIFIVLGILLLVTACINYVNLTTARASIRSKEVSIRKIVGAGRLHLFGQFMSESLLVSFLALIFSLLLVQSTIPWFSSFTDKNFAAPLTSGTVWAIMSLTLVISFLLNGLYPAALLSSFQPINVFRGKNILNFKDTGIRKVLVVVQFTISVALIMGTIVIYTQLNYIQKLDPGYNRSQIFTFSIPWKILGFDAKKRESKLNAIKHDLLQQSAIKDVSMAGGELVNFTGQSSGGFDWAGRPKDFDPAFACLRVDINFQKMMGMKVKEGRWFNSDLSDKHNVLLNETAVELLNIPKPLIGQRFVHQGDTGVIIGVLKDFHYRSLHDKIGPMVVSRDDEGTFYVKTSAGQNQAAILATQKVWQQFVSDVPFKFDFMDESYNSLYKTEQQSSVLITLFAVIAVVVSALGLLGLSAFAAEQKVKEIGIRKVLGASIQHIVSMLSIDFLKMVIIACIIAFPIAWWAMNKWLEGFAYRINVYWWIFGAAGFIALIIAFATISFESFKAAAANPVKSLRSE
jgi:putative ABC transport system permease protein